MEVGLGPGDMCYMGIQLLLKRGTAPLQFSAHFYCGQTAGWIKMPVCTDVDHGPGHNVLDWDPAPPSERPPLFGPRLLWPTAKHLL